MKQKIKKIVLEVLNTLGIVRFVKSTVVSASPLNIQLGNNKRMILPSSVIIVSEHLTNHKREIRVNGGAVQTYEFMDELKKGDKVMVAVVQGGQSFFIIDRVR